MNIKNNKSKSLQGFATGNWTNCMINKQFCSIRYWWTYLHPYSHYFIAITKAAAGGQKDPLNSHVEKEGIRGRFL
jgi:hypothetical protein